jgi:hypothetical protein
MLFGFHIVGIGVYGVECRSINTLPIEEVYDLALLSVLLRITMEEMLKH